MLQSTLRAENAKSERLHDRAKTQMPTKVRRAPEGEEVGQSLSNMAEAMASRRV